jgi:hypothetical protein
MIEVPKITKMDAFSLFQSKTSIFHDERASSMSFPCEKEGEKDAAVLSKVQHHGDKQKRRGDKHTHTNIQNKERPTHSKFKFQIQIARNRTRGSERCEKDHTAIK